MVQQRADALQEYVSLVTSMAINGVAALVPADAGCSLPLPVLVTASGGQVQLRARAADKAMSDLLQRTCSTFLVSLLSSSTSVGSALAAAPDSGDSGDRDGAGAAPSRVGSVELSLHSIVRTHCVQWLVATLSAPTPAAAADPKDNEAVYVLLAALAKASPASSGVEDATDRSELHIVAPHLTEVAGSAVMELLSSSAAGEAAALKLKRLLNALRTASESLLSEEEMAGLSAATTASVVHASNARKALFLLSGNNSFLFNFISLIYRYDRN
jgi:hypothetical protein